MYLDGEVKDYLDISFTQQTINWEIPEENGRFHFKNWGSRQCERKDFGDHEMS